MTSQDNKNNIVEIVNLTKTFKDFWGRPKANAVKGIDFSIGQGEIFGLLGPNGSGKSTTIKMILGLLYPTRGGIRVFGCQPTDFQVKKRIGYLPEESYLYNYLTAEETLMYFGAFFNLSQEECKKRTDQLLEMVGLKHVAKRRIGEFSKGMSRRIGLAQALINDPELVILDEPTAGLDPIGCREIKDIIKVLAKRGKTVLLCSHLLSDVEDVCDNAVIMYGGKIKAAGRLEDMLRQHDVTQLEIKDLKDDDKEHLMSWLNAQGYQNATHLALRKTRLEDYFLQVVQKAKNDSDETAGAQQGGKVAAYLDVTAQEQEANQKLQTLLKKQNNINPTSAESPETPEVSAEKEIKVDYGTLEKLNQVPPEEKSPEPEKTQATIDQERLKANEKLANMLSSNKQE